MNKVLNKVGQVAKAVAAAVVPFVSTSLVTGHVDWRGAAAAGAGALLVYLVPNARPFVPAAGFAPVAAGHPDPEPPTPEIVAPPATGTDASAPVAS